MHNAPATLIAFDFGMRRIGVAVGQTITASATPQPFLLAKAGKPRWESIAELIKKWSVTALVVGLPRNMDGTEQSITTSARQFADHLKSRFQLPVYLVDERLTTKTAKSALAERGKLSKAVVDSYAAKLILEDWLRV